MEDICYSFKEINISEGIFDNIIDCCYVLVMENSEREKTVQKRLSKYGYPCKHIRIQYNKGFHNCDKELKEQKSNYDIIHAYNNVFKDASNNKYNNIMILEDDFIFTDKIQDQNVIQDIEKLYDNMEVNLFNLGPTLFIYNPLYLLYKKNNCVKSFFAPLAHGSIYSRKFYEKFLEEYRLNNITHSHFDYHFNSFFTNGIYTHKNLLCIQSLSVTENSNNWPFGPFDKIVRSLIGFFELDNENPINGFKTVKKINYILNFILYTLIIYLIIIFLKV